MRICSHPWQEGFSAASHSCTWWGGIDEKRNYSAPERGAPAAQLGSYVKGIWGFCIFHMLRVYHSPFPPLLFLCNTDDLRHQSTLLFLSKNWIVMWRFPKFFNLSTPTRFPVEPRIPFSQLHMPLPQRIYELAFRRQLSQTYSKQSVSCKPAIRLNVSTIKNI